MTNESLISEAKALLGNHEDLFEFGDLDAVMMIFAADVHRRLERLLRRVETF